MDKSSSEFVCGDSSEVLLSRESGIARLVATSPPYNVGKAYEQPLDDVNRYVDLIRPVILGINHILVDGGSVCWQVGNYVREGEIIPLDYLFWQEFKNLGFKLRNRIVWTFGHGLHCKNRLSGRYETILWFTKGDDYLFNLDPIRVPQKYPGKKHFKGDKKGELSCNPLGKNPSDVWEIVQQDWESQVWDIPNVKSNHPEKTSHPCQFPCELIERCVLALSNEGDLVVDPFGGVGTTAIAASIHKRHALSIDKEESYVLEAKKRFELLQRGELKTRPIGTPIHKP